MYGGRLSMSSEYEDRDDEMALYVKEHQRGDSTSSSYRQHSQPVPRPETKVKTLYDHSTMLTICILGFLQFSSQDWAFN